MHRFQRSAALAVSLSALVGCGGSADDDPSGDDPGTDPMTPHETHRDGGPSDDPSGDPCNGLDDDGDGDVDEECGCDADATQPCFMGDSEMAGVGACVMGTQRCESNGEFGAAWGACEGSGAPSVEIDGNDVDEDCDGEAFSPACSAVIGEPSERWRAMFEDDASSRWTRIDGTAGDREGNVIITGHFWTTLRIVAPADESPVTLESESGTAKRFVVKISPTGSVLFHDEWETGDLYGGGLNGYWGGGDSIATDASGRFYVTGRKWSAAGADAATTYLIAFDPSGARLWEHSYETGDPYGAGLGWGGDMGLAVDAAGNVTLVGLTSRGVSFGGETLVASGVSAYVARFAPDGTHTFSRLIADGVNIATAGFGAAGIGVSVDREGRAYVTVPIVGPVTFEGVTDAGGGGGVGLAALDASGAPRWTRVFRTGWTDWFAEGGGGGRDVANDAAGNVYLHGGLGLAYDFGGGMIGEARRGYIVSFTPEGEHRWSQATRAEDSYRFRSDDLAVDEGGNVYFTETEAHDEVRLTSLDSDGDLRFEKMIEVAHDNDKWGWTGLATSCGALYLAWSDGWWGGGSDEGAAVLRLSEP